MRSALEISQLVPLLAAVSKSKRWLYLSASFVLLWTDRLSPGTPAKTSGGRHSPHCDGPHASLSSCVAGPHALPPSPHPRSTQHPFCVCSAFIFASVGFCSPPSCVKGETSLPSSPRSEFLRRKGSTFLPLFGTFRRWLGWRTDLRDVLGGARSI